MAELDTHPYRVWMGEYAAFHDLAYEPGFLPANHDALGKPGRDFLRRIQTHMHALNVKAVKVGRPQPYKGVRVSGLLDAETRKALAPDRPSWQEEFVRIIQQDARNPQAAYYTQGAKRWQGVNVVYGLTKVQQQIPYLRSGDCSAGFTRWMLWALQQHLGHVPNDVVNGLSWKAGFTGSIVDTMTRVRGQVKIGDAALFGSGNFHHVMGVIDPAEKLCGNHGSDSGPNIRRWDYNETPAGFWRINEGNA